MRIGRFWQDDDIFYGVIEEDIVRPLVVSPFYEFPDGSTARREEIPLAELKLLAPSIPTKIICLGLNYRGHAREMNHQLPEEPLLFLKPPSSVIGPGDSIVLPRKSKRVDYEGELAIVIGKTAKDVSEANWRDYVMGYTCFNDISERYYQARDEQWTRAKGFDTFASFGPWIETDLSPDNLQIETLVNNRVVQSSRTSDLVFKAPRIIQHISEIMTLMPGDIIATGTPSGIGQLNPGDTVAVTIEGIGTLENLVISQL